MAPTKSCCVSQAYLAELERQVVEAAARVNDLVRFGLMPDHPMLRVAQAELLSVRAKQNSARGRSQADLPPTTPRLIAASARGNDQQFVLPSVFRENISPSVVYCAARRR